MVCFAICYIVEARIPDTCSTGSDPTQPSTQPPAPWQTPLGKKNTFIMCRYKADMCLNVRH